MAPYAISKYCRYNKPVIDISEKHERQRHVYQKIQQLNFLMFGHFISMNREEFEAMFKGKHTTLFRLLSYAKMRDWWLSHRARLYDVFTWLLWMVACVVAGVTAVLVWHGVS
jgi:hypothetical protein